MIVMRGNKLGEMLPSQSPYGAKWFATKKVKAQEGKAEKVKVAIPLRG